MLDTYKRIELDDVPSEITRMCEQRHLQIQHAAKINGEESLYVHYQVADGCGGQIFVKYDGHYYPSDLTDEDTLDIIDSLNMLFHSTF